MPRPVAWVRCRQACSSTFDIHSELDTLSTAPVDVYDIARALCIRVIETSEPGWEAATRFSGDDATIWVRQEAPLVRRRFSVSYELGRILSQPFGEYRDIAPGVGDSQIVDALRWFACCFLMPIPAAKLLVYYSRASFAEMAKHFVVAEQVVGFRVQGIIDGRMDV